MNRTSRLIGIMLVLQGRRATSVPELAQRFEVTRRTLYRDLKALSDAGFPLASDAGRYGVPEGHQLAPVAFPAHEATALLLGARLLGSLGNRSLKALVDAATARLETTLDQKVRSQTRTLLAAVHVRAGRSVRGSQSNGVLELLRAIALHRVARISYAAASTGEVSERSIEPVGLVVSADRLSVVAYCRLRQDARVFRGDRIGHIAVLEERFEPRDEILASLTAPKSSGHEKAVLVELRASVAAAERLRSEFTNNALQEAEDGDCARLTIRFSSFEHAMRLLLGLGAEVEVLTPVSLRDAMAEEAETLHALYLRSRPRARTPS